MTKRKVLKSVLTGIYGILISSIAIYFYSGKFGSYEIAALAITSLTIFLIIFLVIKFKK